VRALQRSPIGANSLAMLRTYGPSCDGSLIDAKAKKIPDTATWVDLEEPTHE